MSTDVTAGRLEAVVSTVAESSEVTAGLLEAVLAVSSYGTDATSALMEVVIAADPGLPIVTSALMEVVIGMPLGGLPGTVAGERLAQMPYVAGGRLRKRRGIPP